MDIHSKRAEQQHIFQLSNNTYSSGELMRDWKQYGAGAFSYEVLEQTPQKGEDSQEIRRKLDKLEKEN